MDAVPALGRAAELSHRSRHRDTSPLRRGVPVCAPAGGIAKASSFRRCHEATPRSRTSAHRAVCRRVLHPRSTRSACRSIGGPRSPRRIHQSGPPVLTPVISRAGVVLAVLGRSFLWSFWSSVLLALRSSGAPSVVISPHGRSGGRSGPWALRSSGWRSRSRSSGWRSSLGLAGSSGGLAVLRRPPVAVLAVLRGFLAVLRVLLRVFLVLLLVLAVVLAVFLVLLQRSSGLPRPPAPVLTVLRSSSSGPPSSPRGPSCVPRGPRRPHSSPHGPPVRSLQRSSSPRRGPPVLTVLHRVAPAVLVAVLVVLALLQSSPLHPRGPRGPRSGHGPLFQPLCASQARSPRRRPSRPASRLCRRGTQSRVAALASRSQAASTSTSTSTSLLLPLHFHFTSTSLLLMAGHGYFTSGRGCSWLLHFRSWLLHFYFHGYFTSSRLLHFHFTSTSTPLHSSPETPSHTPRWRRVLQSSGWRCRTTGADSRCDSTALRAGRLWRRAMRLAAGWSDRGPTRRAPDDRPRNA